MCMDAMYASLFVNLNNEAATCHCARATTPSSSQFSAVRSFKKRFVALLPMKEGLALPSLPRRRVTGNLSRHVIRERKTRLQRFLEVALTVSNKEALRELQAFLAEGYVNLKRVETEEVE